VIHGYNQFTMFYKSIEFSVINIRTKWIEIRGKKKEKGRLADSAKLQLATRIQLYSTIIKI
jgi:hypothetical protein